METPDLAARLTAALGDRYSVSRQIGEGAMGSIFLANDRRHDRQVAIKVLQPSVAAAIGAERFHQEIRIAARLSHPHILPLFDSGEANDLLYFVMPFVDGESLRDRLRREPQLPVAEALRIGAQVADALDYAHRAGVVHRDIKPENILLADGHAKVADFGIARSTATASHLTQTGMSLGTPSYMSPEQLFGDAGVDGRSDQYSLACVIFEMLSGLVPGNAATMQAIIARRMSGAVERVSTHRADVPPMIDLLLARALSADANERLATLAEMAAGLLGEITGGHGPRLANAQSAPLAQKAPLVGREQEREAARSMLADLAAGRGGMLLIGGEPGVGKTRLCQEILDDARRAGAICLVGRSYEMEGTAAYTPFAEMLDTVSRLVPRPTFREVLGDAAGEIARVHPALRGMFSDIEAPLDLPPDRQRGYLHQKYREFLERASRVAPIVALFDDLHWADDASLALLEHEAGYLATIPVLVLGTYRDVELDVHRGFAHTLEGLTRQRLARRLSLKRLSRAGVAELLTALAAGNSPPPAELARVIHAETDGNPFFVEEVFAHLEEEGKLFDERGGWRDDLRIDELDVPEGVRLVIGRRLERLSDECRQVLTSAAMIGPRFELAVLERMEDASEDGVLDALDAATRAGLVVEQRSGRDVQYAFSHELIRQALLANLSLPRRQRRHLKVAHAIETAMGTRVNARASDMAYHLYQAGAVADADRANYYHMLAAEQACRSAAYPEALAYLERATTLDETSDVGVRARLAGARAQALQGRAQWVESTQAFETALGLAMAAGNVPLVADSAYQCAMLLTWAGRMDDAIAVAERAADWMPLDERGRRSILLARAAAFRGIAHADDAEARQRLTEAQRLAEGTGPEVQGMVTAAFANYTFHFARFDEGIEQCLRVRRLLATPEHRQVAIETWGFQHLMHYYAGRWAEHTTERASLRRAADVAGNAGALLIIDSQEAWIEETQAGQLVRLESRSRDVGDRWTPIGPASHLVHAGTGAAQLMRGDIDGAAETLRLHREQIRFPTWRGTLEMFEIVAAALKGGSAWHEQHTRFRELMPQVDSVPTIGRAAFGLGLAAAYHLRDDREPLAALYPALADIRMRGFRVALYYVIDAVLGLAASAREDWSAAERHFDDALAFVEDTRNQLALPITQQWYAEMLRARGTLDDRARANALLTSAIIGYEALGMPVMLARCPRQ